MEDLFYWYQNNIYVGYGCSNSEPQKLMTKEGYHNVS